MKLGIEFHYTNLSSKRRFPKNWLSESYSLIKGVKQCASLVLTSNDIFLSLEFLYNRSPRCSVQRKRVSRTSGQ